MLDFLQQLFNPSAAGAATAAEGAASGGGSWLDMFKPIDNWIRDPNARSEIFRPLDFNKMLGVNQPPQPGMPAGGQPNQPGPLAAQNDPMANQLQQQMLMSMLANRQPQQGQGEQPMNAAPSAPPMLPTRFASNRAAAAMPANQGMSINTSNPMGMQLPQQVMSPARRKIIGSSLI